MAFEYFFTTPILSEEQQFDFDVITVFDDHTFVESGVTSGADPSDWDPIEIDRDDGNDQDEDEDVIEVDSNTDNQPAGVTSGSDMVDDNVKSSKRKNKQQ